jgi:hypothetical protein
MEIKNQLKIWLDEILPIFSSFEECFKIENTGPESYSIKFYTRTYEYSICADDNYLGCQVSERKPRAGENWTRGNDLSDGSFNAETWREIKDDIISYELVNIAKKQRDKTIQITENKP